MDSLKGHEQQPLMPMGNSCCSSLNAAQSKFRLHAKTQIPSTLFHLSFKMPISLEQHLGLMINKVSLQNTLEKCYTLDFKKNKTFHKVFAK